MSQSKHVLSGAQKEEAKLTSYPCSKESDLQSLCMSWLMSQQINFRRILAFKLGSGAFNVAKADGSSRYVRLTGGFNLGNGIPDCVCMLYGKQGFGKVFWIEFKMPGKSLTDNQKYVLKMMIELNQAVFVCRSFEDLQKIIDLVKRFDKDEASAMAEITDMIKHETEFDLFKPRRSRQRKLTLPEEKERK